MSGVEKPTEYLLRTASFTTISWLAEFRDQPLFFYLSVQTSTVSRLLINACVGRVKRDTGHLMSSYWWWDLSLVLTFSLFFHSTLLSFLTPLSLESVTYVTSWKSKHYKWPDQIQLNKFHRSRLLVTLKLNLQRL